MEKEPRNTDSVQNETKTTKVADNPKAAGGVAKTRKVNESKLRNDKVSRSACCLEERTQQKAVDTYLGTQGILSDVPSGCGFCPHTLLLAHARYPVFFFRLQTGRRSGVCRIQAFSEDVFHQGILDVFRKYAVFEYHEASAYNGDIGYHLGFLKRNEEYLCEENPPDADLSSALYVVGRCCIDFLIDFKSLGDRYD